MYGLHAVRTTLPLRRLTPRQGSHRRARLVRRGRRLRLPLFRRHPRRRTPTIHHGAHGHGLLVLDRAHSGGDVGRFQSSPHGCNLGGVIAADGGQLAPERERRIGLAAGARPSC